MARNATVARRAGHSAMALASLMGLGEHPARRVAVVDCRDDDAGSVDSGEVLRRVEAVTQPAPLHGAGVCHEPYSGPFLRPPSARGIRTRPQLRTDPPFSWPDTIPAAQQRGGTQQAHTYVPQFVVIQMLSRVRAWSHMPAFAAQAPIHTPTTTGGAGVPAWQRHRSVLEAGPGTP